MKKFTKKVVALASALFMLATPLTAMAIQTLAKYQDKANVKKATDRAVSCLSKMQNKNGGYGSKEGENAESTAQVIVALTELGISLQDARFVKNGKSTLDHLLTFLS